MNMLYIGLLNVNIYWNNKEYTDFEKLADIELELNNKINPCYFGAFDIEKTI